MPAGCLTGGWRAGGKRRAASQGGGGGEAGATAERENASPRRELPEIIALAEVDAALAQDPVGRRVVEIEIRQGESEEVVLPAELARLAADRDADLARLGAVDLRRLEGMEKICRLGDPRLQLGET